MDVYFVRHGQTELGERCIHQFPQTPVSEQGRESLHILRSTIQQLNINHVITSDYTRAVETAEHVALSGASIIVSPLFHEIVRPSSLLGTSQFSFRTAWYIVCSLIFWWRTKWRYQDAENYTDVVTRMHNARAYLESFHAETSALVVVTHSIYLSLFISFLLQGKFSCIHTIIGIFVHRNYIKNAAIIHMRYDSSAKKWLREDIKHTQ